MSVEIDGQTYAGIWRVERGLLSVASSRGRKSSRLADDDEHPQSLARVLLRELVEESCRPRQTAESARGI